MRYVTPPAMPYAGNGAKKRDRESSEAWRISDHDVALPGRMLMPPYPLTPAAAIAKMCKDLKSESTLSDRTVNNYVSMMNTIIALFEKNGRHVLPQEIDRSDVKWLLEYHQSKNHTVQTKRGYISALRKYTSHYGNSVIKDMRIRWPVDMRPNADWLTTGQAKSLLALHKTPIQDVLVHCELCLGMRRVEVLRLRPDSFSGTYVDVLGKGPQGGKPRRIPYHRDTRRMYDRWMNHRDMIIKLARSQYPVSTNVPDLFLIWSRGNRLYPYSLKGESVDRHLKDLAHKIECPGMSHHTLRRTFGREMYRSSPDRVPTIAKIMGHDSVDQCLKYLGIELDDMTAVMGAYSLG